MLFLQYPPCSTCQKAKKWLDGHGVGYTPRHIKEEILPLRSFLSGCTEADCR